MKTHTHYTTSAANVKEAVDAAEFYGNELDQFKLSTRRGWVNTGLCPFHDDHHTGSFAVNIDTGAYRCFSCGAKGDVFAFVMERHGLTFREALEYVAEMGGVR